MLILAWMMLLLIGGLFPKKRSSTKKTLKFEAVYYKRKGN
ncbi:Uncharacterized protein BC141101_01850 [Bacillus toyonensis]|nr:hypothetical protein bcere0020_23050 [Bacillus cereus Rock3-29]SCN16653.1 Uncharacterized protein BC141101_01850 [Bacillus toyonensis]